MRECFKETNNCVYPKCPNSYLNILQYNFWLWAVLIRNLKLKKQAKH